MNAISTVVFDLGRVLVNIDFDAFPNALELTTPESRAPYRSAVAVQSRLYETGKISTDEFISRLFDVFQKKYTRDHLLFAWNEIILEDVPGIAHLIDIVAERHGTAMLSNTSASHFEKAERECSTVKKIARRFLSFEIGEAKPAPGIYRHVIRELQTDPSRLLFIDDLPENIEAAREAGMNGLLFTGLDRLQRDLIEWNILTPPPPLPSNGSE
jgi:putative hydrolase of the HAD superfamily